MNQGSEQVYTFEDKDVSSFKDDQYYTLRVYSLQDVELIVTDERQISQDSWSEYLILQKEG